MAESTVELNRSMVTQGDQDLLQGIERQARQIRDLCVALGIAMTIEDTWGAETKHIQGGPFKILESGESTAQIERFHKTLEQRTKVFEKFKDIDSIKLLTGGWLINYNFFKQNEGCGNIPPAQVASKFVPFKDWNDIG
jgi:hypothetical protein